MLTSLPLFYEVTLKNVGELWAFLSVTFLKKIYGFEWVLCLE